MAGREGVYGLQRAFHAAGAHNIIASLWKVDDDATRTLMEEFYKNLWEKKFSKLEALRQAQLTIFRRYNPGSGKLRSRTLKDKDQKSDVKQIGRTLPAFYWAAFVLSGDGGR